MIRSSSLARKRCLPCGIARCKRADCYSTGAMSFSMNKVAVPMPAPPEQRDRVAGVKRQGVNNDRASKVLKVSDLLGTHGLTKNVPHKSLKEIVFRKLSMCDRMVAIDVETHDLVPRGLSVG